MVQFEAIEPLTSTKGTMDPKGALLLTYTLVYVYGKPSLPYVHKYSSLRSTQSTALQQTATSTLRRQCTSEGPMSSFKSIA